MKQVERAAFGATYKTVWCAGPSIEYVTCVQPLEKIIKKLVDEFKLCQNGIG
jgi:nitronate monooxygenase